MSYSYSFVVCNKYTAFIYGIFDTFGKAVVEQAKQNEFFGFEPGNDPACIKMEIKYELRLRSN